MRELDVMLKAIEKRRHNEIAVQASFHGIKIPIRGAKEPEVKIEISEADAMAQQRALAEAKRKISERFANRYGS